VVITTIFQGKKLKVAGGRKGRVFWGGKKILVLKGVGGCPGKKEQQWGEPAGGKRGGGVETERKGERSDFEKGETLKRCLNTCRSQHAVDHKKRGGEEGHGGVLWCAIGEGQKIRRREEACGIIEEGKKELTEERGNFTRSKRWRRRKLT